MDRDASINVWRAAAASKVRTFVLVATFEGRASRSRAAISEAKEQAVDTVMRESRAAGVRFCVLRPTAYFKDMTAWLVDPILAGRPARITGSGAPRINPIDGADLAQLVRECVAEGGSENRELLVGGPQVYTLRGMAELAVEVAGPARPGGEGGAGTTGGDQAAAASAADLIKPRRLWPLRLLAPFARCLSPFSSRAAALADGARFVLYSATHDAVGDPYGRRLLRGAFEARVACVRAAAAAAAGVASAGATPSAAAATAAAAAASPGAASAGRPVSGGGGGGAAAAGGAASPAERQGMPRSASAVKMK